MLTDFQVEARIFSNSKFNKVLSFLPAFFLLLLLIMLLLAVLFRARARARLRARWRTDSNLELLKDFERHFFWGGSVSIGGRSSFMTMPDMTGDPLSKEILSIKITCPFFYIRERGRPARSNDAGGTPALPG
jgi:hypothetical protein